MLQAYLRLDTWLVVEALFAMGPTVSRFSTKSKHLKISLSAYFTVDRRQCCLRQSICTLCIPMVYFALRTTFPPQTRGEKSNRET